MEQNFLILKNWFSSFENYQKLSLKKAQEVYIHFIHSTNIEEKNVLKEKLVLGTMYVVYETIKDSFLVYLPSNKCNVEDIIQAGILVWMEFINNGKILDISYYSDFFRRDFFLKIAQSLLCSERNKDASFLYFEFFGVEKQSFFTCLFQYILLREKMGKLSYSQFLQTFKEFPTLRSFYSFFEEIYSLVDSVSILDKEENFSYRKIAFFLPYIMEEVLYSIYNSKDPSNVFLEIENPLNEIECQLLRNRVREIYEILELPSYRNKKMTAAFYGMQGKRKSFGNLSKEYNLSKQSVQQSVQRTLKLIRKKYPYSKELRNIYEELEKTN